MCHVTKSTLGFHVLTESTVPVMLLNIRVHVWGGLLCPDSPLSVWGNLLCPDSPLSVWGGPTVP